MLDIYVPSSSRPLPQPPDDWEQPTLVAIDAPQGLPALGMARRAADAGANTPTRKLPADRQELANWKLYKGLIEAGIVIFWSIHELRLGSIFGLNATTGRRSTVFETYPRYVAKRLWPNLTIPSKRNAAYEYVDVIWRLLRERGYRCTSVRRPSVDHVDAMLCALAAEGWDGADGRPKGTVGMNPTVDLAARVLREGFIVSP